MIDITVPTLPESVPDATLLEWQKAIGAQVARDEILVELETDKVVIEVTAPQDGVLKEILRQSGQQVLADDVLARLETDLTDSAAPRKAATDESVTEEMAFGPAVRQLLAEHHLDAKTVLEATTGSGRDGRLTKGDVLAYLEVQKASSPAPGRDTLPAQAPQDPISAPDASLASRPADAAPLSRAERRVPMSRIRARIAERLIESQQTAAILTTFNEANLQAIMDLRERFRAPFEKAHGVQLGMMSFFVKATVQALRQFPIVNASLEGADILYHDYYDIGIAVGSSRGLVVPILRDSERLSFAGIEAKIAEFGKKANAAQLTIDDLSGGTFSITNGGIFGSLMSTPILNPPQSAILGMHKIQERPIAENGQVVIRPMMYLALSYDHRLIDGQDAVRFLVAVKEGIEDPHRLLLEI
uniref:Dihydrolipoyllysine-residue succinyltransferase component of 2-oxoglutarate dehydrogenase complex n=1 Tax=Candidatus Kentrum sp. FM TaxID=2126340 RepID=A0A450W702_9GAMM|nr:MAG: 2-oxoglutarate dehydrogenase E2 component (dihydrolipoamide succinyltransferase) [Candidatus Kentron sp. FM]